MALGCEVADLSRDRTLVVRHGPTLSDYPGLFALKRNMSCIISVPPAGFATAVALFAGRPPRAAFEGSLLQRAVAPASGTVIGPAWLSYADRTDFRAADSRGARLLTHRDAAALRALEVACDLVAWEHSGIDASHDLLFISFHRVMCRPYLATYQSLDVWISALIVWIRALSGGQVTLLQV